MIEKKLNSGYDIKLTLTGLWFRMNDKIQRLKQLVIMGEPDTVGESIDDTFVQVYRMRKLSALLSPTGQPTMIPLQVFACAKCGHINKGFQPKED